MTFSESCSTVHTDISFNFERNLRANILWSFFKGLQCTTYSMVMELFSPRYRTLAGCVVEAFWAAGIILLALIAKYVRHWRYIQLAINIPTIATIFYIW